MRITREIFGVNIDRKGGDLAPASANVTSGGSLQLQATVAGAADTGVLWSMRETAAAGSVDSAGLYTAPRSAGVYHVIATSHADPSRAAAAAINVLPQPPTALPRCPFNNIGARLPVLHGKH